MIDFFTTDGQKNVQRLLNDSLALICELRNEKESLQNRIDWYSDQLSAQYSKEEELRKEITELNLKIATMKEAKADEAV